MLNCNGQRELAYVVIVTDVLPMDADKLECVQVNGWNCVCSKGTFKKGDLGIFFEIDSLLPEVEPFTSMEFLKSKHYKIKSQRIRGVVSQGLLLSPKDFGWEILEDGGLEPEGIAYMGKDNGETFLKNGNNYYCKGDFLTEELGVTYYIKEDNIRKSSDDPNEKYKKMCQRHSELAQAKWWKWLYKRIWGKELLFTFFGKKKDTSNKFPKHFEYIHVTDEERCLPGGTKVLTEQGWVQINKLVNSKLATKVASMNSDGSIEYKKILDYQKFNNDKPMITIKYAYRPDVGRTNALCCTEDHKCFTQRGYIEAKDLTLNDYVYTPCLAYDEKALEAIYGMLLGDSHIANDRRSHGMLRHVATNGEKQLEYLRYKKSLFTDDTGKIVNSGIGSFSNLPCYHWSTDADPYFSMNMRKDWYQTGSKHISDPVIAKLSAVSLAFWYMDDGSISYNATNRYFIRLATQGFSFDENEKLCLMLLEKFNIKANILKDKLAKDGHQLYFIEIASIKECDKFFTLISPYICDSMLYKLPEKFKNRELIKLSFKKSWRALPIPIKSIEMGQTKNKTWGKKFNIVYDIEVEDNHNFIADNIIVHNCENIPWILNLKDPWIQTTKIDGTSSTYILERKHFGRFEYYVCSRNVRQMNRNQKNYHNDFGAEDNVYWAMNDKYKIYDFLRAYIEFDHYDYVCLQGETAGPNIQGNPHKFNELQFFGFNLINSKEGRINSENAEFLCNLYNIPWVPIINTNYILPDTMEELKLSADGPCEAPGASGLREGYVYRSLDGKHSFKNVSREYSLKQN